MRRKSEVLDKFKEFEAITTNELSGESIGTLRLDNGVNIFQISLKPI